MLSRADRSLKRYGDIIRPALAPASALAFVFATPVHATNERYLATSKFCQIGVDCGGSAPLPRTTPQVATSGAGGAGAYAINGGLTSASVSLEPGAPTLVTGLFAATSTAQLNYTFQVRGPSRILVPLHVVGNISVSPISATDYRGINYAVGDSPYGYQVLTQPSNFAIAAGAGLSVLQDAAPVGSIHAAVDDYLNFTSGSFSPGLAGAVRNVTGDGALIDRTYWVYANTDIAVEISAMAQLQYDGAPRSFGNQYGSVSAFADPTFTIDDPSYGAYSAFGVPSGAGPLSPVPESATWIMMIAGLGATASTMRRRRPTEAHLGRGR